MPVRMSTLAVTKDEYDYLKNNILLDTNNYSSNKNHVASLKHKYSEIINSVRRSDSIVSLKDLVEVLEKRDAVSENDLNILEYIARETGNQHFLREIDSLRIKNTCHNPPSMMIEPNRHRFISTCDKYDVNKRVREVIETRLGNKWVDFARALNLVESKIDYLRIHYDNNTELCTKAVLEFHDRNAHPREWKTLLLNALEKARRTDLKNEVNRIFDTFSG